METSYNDSVVANDSIGISIPIIGIEMVVFDVIDLLSLAFDSRLRILPRGHNPSLQ
jgi:hypothetical protein